MNATTLPILDLARYFNPAERDAFLDQLRTSARDIGFFYLINHGVNDELQRAVQHEARRFFALSDEQKQQVAMIHSPHFRGYNRAASELTRGKPDWREQFDIGAERPALQLDENAPRWRRLQGPNLWPEEQPALKTTLLEWQKSMTEMAIVLLRAFAEALALPADAFDALYGNKPNEHIKLIRYPGQESSQSNQGVGAHKDSGFLSFLLQDEQKGLQVEVSPDHWIDAVPLPGSLWSISVSCWSWRPMAICGPPCTAFSHHRRDRIACRLPSSSAHNWMPSSRFTRCLRHWHVTRRGRKAIRITPFYGT